MMRRRGPSLVRAAATTAVVVGTANAVSNSQQQKYNSQAQAQQNQADMAAMQAQQDQLAQQQAAMAAQQQAAAAPAPAAAPSGGISQDQINQLTQLSELQKQGVITQDEFDAKKKQILGL